ncbi:MAG: hypothetical protein N2D54_08805, partial [Chloroflexota bacterium]
LEQQFEISLEQLDQDFVANLQLAADDQREKDDLQFTVVFFDTLRRYQILYDPSAYFLDMWIVPLHQIRQNKLIADALRHPTASENVALETMLIAAAQFAAENNFKDGSALLSSVNQVLASTEEGEKFPFSTNNTAASYLLIVNELVNSGYQTESITLNKNSAQVLVKSSGPNLISLTLSLSQGAWRLD